MTMAAQCLSRGLPRGGSRLHLLESKLAPPPPPERLVPRPRLTAALDRAADGPATLLSAPPGYGKTVLLSSWVAGGSPPGPVAWLSLDHCDNDPHRFWSLLGSALRRAGALPRGSELDSGFPADEPGDWLLPVLLDDLQRPAPLVLVLDDVHELTDVRVRGVVDMLLRHAGPKLRLVLAARWDPVLSLHRLALDGRLTQLRAADLAFAPGEVLGLMSRFGLSGRMSHRDVELLHARTEGWAAALRLAAASMTREPDLHRFIAQLAGDDRSVSGYLFSEVWARQPAELRRFMLHTCIVDELNPELADALTGTGDGVRALAELERTNSLVSSVGSDPDAYRYHPLFAELLRHELRRQEPQAVRGLRRRAAVWYRDHGSPEQAVLQGVALDDCGFVADVVIEHGFTQMFRGDDAAARTLLDKVPSKAFQADPALALLDAAERLLSGEDWGGASLRLALEQERSVPAARRPRLGLVLGACWAVSATRAGDLEGVRRAGRHLLAAHRQLGPDVGSGVVRDALAVGLPRVAAAALWRGEHDDAEAHLRLGHAAALGARLLDEQVVCLGLLALSQALRGRLNEALSTAEAALATAGRRDHRAGQSAAARLAQAQVHYARDEIPAAEARLQQVDAASLSRADVLRVLHSILEGRCRLALHDPTGALRALDKARGDLVRSEDTVMLCGRLALAEVETHVTLGNLSEARSALARLQPLSAPTGAALLASERLRLAESGHPGAPMPVSPLQDAAAPEGDVSEEIRRALLVALALDLDDRGEQVPAMLQRAVDLAEAEDHRRLFLDSGGVGRRLLAKYRNEVDASWPFLDEVAVSTADPNPVAVPPAPVHMETLSRRELDVLRYLPTMLTFAEIGARLFISVNTTKSHVRSIYRKLGVDGRREAVRRARQLQLLRP